MRDVAARSGVPRTTLQSLLDGSVPSINRAADICEALGITLTLGPPRAPSDLSFEGRDTEAGLSPTHLKDLEGHTRGLIRVVVEAGGDPSWVERHAWEEEVRVESGRVAVEVGGERRELGPGESMRIPAGELHSHYSLEPSRWVLLAEGAGEGLDDPSALAEPSIEYDPGIRQIGVVAALDDDDIPPGARPVDVHGVRAAGGGGSLVESEMVRGQAWFRQDWLDSHGLDATRCAIIQVSGDSMAPTLSAGCSILVNRAETRRQAGRIYVLRMEEGLVVKRAGRSEDGGWLLTSDNESPDWPSVPWPREAEVIGEVRWMAKTL